MVDRCVRKDSSSCEGDSAGITTRGVHPHAAANHTVFFLCHGFIKFMYINENLFITCYNVNYFGSQPVGLDLASGSEYCQ